MLTEVMFSMLALLFDLLVSLSLLVIETKLEMFPAEITSAMIVNVWTSPFVRLPMTQVEPSHSPTLVSLDITLRSGLKTSLTYTPVALHGPVFVTVTVNLILSVTLTMPETLTSFVIIKSTLLIAVKLTLALLFV